MPVDDVERLVDGLRRTPVGASARSPALAARELLERAGAASTEPCVLDGAIAWEVLWAIQWLPDDAISPALDSLRRALLQLTSAPLGRAPAADADEGSAAVTRLR